MRESHFSSVNSFGPVASHVCKYDLITATTPTKFGEGGGPPTPKKNFFSFENVHFCTCLHATSPGFVFPASVANDDRQTKLRNVIPSSCYARGRRRPRATKICCEIS
jgi:hypothetical protein